MCGVGPNPIVFLIPFGGLLLATGGTVLELANKHIDRKTYPITRVLLDVAARVMQSAMIVIAMFVFAELIHSGLPILAGLVIIPIMVLTPVLKALAEKIDNDDDVLKKIVNIADRIVSLTIRILNSAIVIFGTAKLWDDSIFTLAYGLGFATLSVITYLKSEANIEQIEPAGLNLT